MNVGIMGLGRMGMGMGARLVKRSHKIAGYDVSPDKRPDAEEAGIMWAENPSDMGSLLDAPRVVIISVPAGEPVDSAINSIVDSLSRGDIIIDSGNSFYGDSIRRGRSLEERGIEFLDVGVSGGVWGLQQGFCLMIGGKGETFERAEPIFRELAADDGYAYVGKSGAGHFAKMVHNGVEYGILEAYAEGFEVLKSSDFGYDLAGIADLWNHGGVVRSWLLELAKLAFEESPDLGNIKGWVEDSGMGRWTLMESIEQRVPAPVIALSLMMRFRSRQDDSFSAKVIAALRQKFGGHSVKQE
ncbi:MAG: phosphogluconate dehydrogenase (NAD(+)-dependent, decarboxylating) [Armatimonadota bacterium]|nr:decarboxylating 6-phosphogluconate dehydrogenase [bacterium]